MHTPNPPDGKQHGSQGLSPTGMQASTPGYETSDIQVGGIVVFLVSLMVFLVIFFVFCFVMGRVINTHYAKQDGPPNKWNQAGAPRGRNLESNAVLEQQQLHAMTVRFPTPRLETDDGDQDVADLHQREDLLLDHYTWIDRGQGTVRIPIGQAMEEIAARGLPVLGSGPAAGGAAARPGAAGPSSSGPSPAGAAASGSAPAALLAGDTEPGVTEPLTNGFARTGYEQQLGFEQARQAQQEAGSARNKEQAQLAPH